MTQSIEWYVDGKNKSKTLHSFPLLHYARYLCVVYSQTLYKEPSFSGYFTWKNVDRLLTDDQERALPRLSQTKVLLCLWSVSKTKWTSEGHTLKGINCTKFKQSQSTNNSHINFHGFFSWRYCNCNAPCATHLVLLHAVELVAL